MSRTDRTPRRRLDPQTRRATILDVARVAFATHPYDKVAVVSIARTAQASEALLYRYFANKARLYTSVITNLIDTLIDDQIDTVAALPDTATSEEKIRVALDVFLTYVHSDLRLLMLPGNDPPEAVKARAQVRTLLAETLQEIGGFPSRDVLTLTGVIGFLESVCIVWAGNGCPAEQRDELIEATLGALFGAVERASTAQT